MSERGGKPMRLLRAVRPNTLAETPRETAESVLPGLPRVGALDALLREVDSLRLTLETDLSLAASAVEAGAPGIAVDIIDSDRDGLRAFEARALSHLSDLAEEPTVGRRWWTRVPAAPFVAAAALVGFLVGVGPQNLGGSPGQTTTQVSASQSLAQLTEFAATGQTSQVRDVAVNLHSQLLALVAQAKTDPAAAQRGLAMLVAERAVIAQSGDSQALGDVLAASTDLSNRIIQALPASVRTAAATPPPTTVAVPTTRPTAKPSTAPSTASSSYPSTKPTTKPSSSTKPQPSSSPTKDPSVLPSNPAVAP